MMKLPSRPDNAASLPRHQDTSLLPEEDIDLRRDIMRTVGEDWMHARNAWLGNRTPYDLIGTPDEFHVRALLRSIKAAALS